MKNVDKTLLSELHDDPDYVVWWDGLYEYA